MRNPRHWLVAISVTYNMAMYRLNEPNYEYWAIATMRRHYWGAPGPGVLLLLFLPVSPVDQVWLVPNWLAWLFQVSYPGVLLVANCSFLHGGLHEQPTISGVYQREYCLMTLQTFCTPNGTYLKLMDMRRRSNVLVINRSLDFMD